MVTKTVKPVEKLFSSGGVFLKHTEKHVHFDKFVNLHMMVSVDNYNIFDETVIKVRGLAL